MPNRAFKRLQSLRETLVIVLVLQIGTILGNEIECGTVNLYRELILGGNEVVRNQWPFIAALSHSRHNKYFCGGTIITNRHVLTAKSESNVVNRNVTQIYVHPDWNVHDEMYDADIAILTLNDTIAFSNNIRPICMPSDDADIDGVKGIVVGWGLTENGTVEGIPRQTETFALNDSYCYRTDQGIARYASERSFCGGSGDGTPNNGDSGSGLFAIFGSAWVQYGTVSVVRANATGHITVSSFAVYSKVKSFKQWISETVKQSTGAVVSEASMKINLHCLYGYDTDGYYGCWLHDLDIRKEHFVVNTVTGSQKFELTDEHVQLVVFHNGTMFYVPDKLGFIFPNLKYLTVGDASSMSLGTKRIERSIFQNLEQLEELRFLSNDIGVLALL